MRSLKNIMTKKSIKTQQKSDKDKVTSKWESSISEIKSGNKIRVSDILPSFSADEKFLLKSKQRVITEEEITENARRKGSFYEGYSQDKVPVKSFIGGMIQTKNNDFVKILEVFPINYYQKDKKTQNNIIQSYASFFRISPAVTEVIATTESTNMIKLLDNLQIQYQKEKNALLKERIEYFIRYIQELAKTKSYTKKFYVVFKYEGKSNDLNEIYRDVTMTAMQLEIRFSEMGNLCLTHDQDNKFNIDVLYRFYNRKSMYEESSDMRYMRIMSDTQSFNLGIMDGQEIRGIDEASFVAPRGYDNSYSDALLVDGTYITFLALQADGYPENVYGGWVDSIYGYGNGIDLTTYFHRVESEPAIQRLKTTTRLSRVSSKALAQKNPEKYQEKMKVLQNKSNLLSSLQNGENLFYVNIIITIRGKSLTEVRDKRRTIKKDLEAKSVYLEECYKDAEDYYASTVPLCSLNQNIYRRTRQNMTNMGCASTYPYTSYELFDETGIVLGQMDNNSIVALNNYNTQRYTNANILILGTSGAGKTFLEQCMSTRQTMIGIRTFYLLPVKGHEYYKGVISHGGSYIKLHPGCDTCINIMEIRPEITLDRDLIEDAPEMEQSLLSKKVITLSVFITLQLKENEDITTAEMNYLNVCIVSLYRDYGITDDNDSIWKDKKRHILKKMPHLSDLYDRMKVMPQLKRLTPLLLPFINGIFANMNGDTNVDLEASSIAFDVNREIIGDQFIASIMYLAFNLIIDMTKSSRLYFDSIYLDEVWIMTKNKSCANQVQSLLKLIRGYGGAAIVATQDIFDLLKNEFGPAIIGNTDIKMLLKMKDKEAARVADYIDLSENDIDKIRKFNRGDCMLITNGDKVNLHIEASPEEIRCFTTDPNLLRQFAEEERKNKTRQKK